MMQSHDRKTLLACIIGNIIEWYEFIIFGYFSAILSQVFFDPTSSSNSLLKVLGIFSIGVLVRPLGGVLLGHVGDKFGRKKALIYSTYLMAVPTFILGILPGYEVLGSFASIILCLIRVLQGLALGGEYAGVIVFLIEKNSSNQQGWYGSIAALSLVTGMILGGFVSTLLYACLTDSQLYNWGWRIPFLLSFVGLIWGGYLRAVLEESKTFKAYQQQNRVVKFPIKECLFFWFPQLLQSVGVQIYLAVGMYTLTVFYASNITNLFKNTNPFYLFLVNIIGLGLLGLSAIISGKLSDHFSQRKSLFVSLTCGIFINLCLLFFHQTETFLNFIIAFFITAILIGSFLGLIPAYLVKFFPLNIRYTSVALSNNLSMGFFGGTAPLLMTYLMKIYPNLPISTYGLMISSMFSWIVLKISNRKI